MRIIEAVENGITSSKRKRKIERSIQSITIVYVCEVQCVRSIGINVIVLIMSLTSYKVYISLLLFSSSFTFSQNS